MIKFINFNIYFFNGEIIKYKLKKELGLFELSLYGIGIILGAGIYSLIGIGAGIAGNAIWISFIFAAFIAAFTGLSYAELSSMYPKEAAEYNYTKIAFNKKNLSFIIGWLMIIASVVAGVTVAFGFAGYFSHIFGGSATLITSILVIILSLINYIGIKESSTFNIISTIIETLGLVIVIALGIYHFFTSGININIFEIPFNNGLSALLSATTLIFFAYLGFEDIVNVSEETKNAKKIVPKSLVIAIIVSTILYILVSFSAVNIIGWERLAGSKAPLTEVVSSIIPNSDWLFSFIALFATANTSLILLIVGSRILYGMAKDKTLPRVFSRIGKRGTPFYSVIFVGIVSLIIALIGSIKTVAMITDISLFLVYFSVNGSLLVLRYKKPDMKRGFRTPLNIGKFSVLAFLGLLSSIGMMFYFEKNIILIEVGVVLGGFIIYNILNSKLFLSTHLSKK